MDANKGNMSILAKNSEAQALNDFDFPRSVTDEIMAEVINIKG